ncbi:MAG: S-layer homology domain-containing protein, partial [Firmicutes bacterium]|nr:S-layer homology domain-containing protein [Bacillota bacterium]
MKNRLLSMLTVFVLLFVFAFGAMVPVQAASKEATISADALYSLGLFSGTGTDADGKPIYELDRAPTRNEAVAMLVRLLGKETEAKAGEWEIPFTDVAAWAKPYVGYAYAKGLTAGTSATTYSGDAKITASQYLTFVLRSLGYDSSKDFKWDRAWELSDKIGLTDGRYDVTTKTFLRGDVTIISNNSLQVK